MANHHEERTPFQYRERITIASETTEELVNVKLESTSVLSWNKTDTEELPSFVTPFSLVLRQLLAQHASVQEMSFRVSSFESLGAPSGLHLVVQFDKQHDSVTTRDERLQIFYSLVDKLVANRLILSPLDSIHQERLHRNVYTIEDHQMEIILPMEGSSMFGAEGMAAFFRQAITSSSGIWGLGDATTWSNLLLGVSSQTMLSSKRPRSIWWTLQKDDQTFSFRQGIEYAKQLRTTSSRAKLSLAQLLPGNPKQVSSCSMGPSDLAIVSNGIDELVVHNLAELDFTKPMIEVAGESSNDNGSGSPSWKITKTVKRPHGVANTGTITVTVTNPCPCEKGSLLEYLQDIIPSYIEPRWSTFHTSLGQNASLVPQVRKRFDGSLDLAFRKVILPPGSALVFSYDYDPLLLGFELFPADPNRGMELPVAIARMTSLCPPSSSLDDSTRLVYSNSVLLMPPVPDMSMPFNVISLTCTLYVFIIGYIVNSLVRRTSERLTYTLYPERKPKSKLTRLKERVKAKLSVLKRQQQGTKNKGETSKQEETSQEPTT